MPLTLFHAPRSRSIRVRWLLEEMGVPHELQRMEQRFGDLGGEAYKKIHPLQKSPALKDGDQVIVESTAILEYVAGRYGPTPLAATAADEDFGPYLQWLHFGEAGMGGYMNMLIGQVWVLPADKRSAGLQKWAEREIDACFGFIAAGLGDKDFMLERGFSVADISIGYMLFLTKLMKRMDRQPDTIQAYWERLIARPAWRVASGD